MSDKYASDVMWEVRKEAAKYLPAVGTMDRDEYGVTVIHLGRQAIFTTKGVDRLALVGASYRRVRSGYLTSEYVRKAALQWLVQGISW